MSEHFDGLVAVIAGGLSHERDVSLASGRGLDKELGAQGVDVAVYDFDRNLLSHLQRDRAVVAYPALHGEHGEDGEIQTLLELLRLPYVGAGPASARLAYDKGNARELLSRAGLAVPQSVGLSAQTFRDIGANALMEHVLDTLGHRVVVKPARGGSALGVTGVDGLALLPSALVETYAYCDDALIEKFYTGVDVSVAVVEHDHGLEALTPVAIDFTKGHEFDFAARYTAEFVGLAPAPFDAATLTALKDAAITAHTALGLRDVSRSDFIVAPDGSSVLLEVAITPGTTETSVFPYACQVSGTSLGEVAVELLKRALARA